MKAYWIAQVTVNDPDQYRFLLFVLDSDQRDALLEGELFGGSRLREMALGFLLLCRLALLVATSAAAQPLAGMDGPAHRPGPLEGGHYG